MHQTLQASGRQSDATVATRSSPAGRSLQCAVQLKVALISVAFLLSACSSRVPGPSVAPGGESPSVMSPSVGTQPFNVGINAKIAPAKVRLALDFVEVATRADVTEAAMRPHPPSATPQYLTPVRKSVLADLAKGNPLYGAIRYYADGPAAAFRIGPTARAWLAANGAGIRKRIFESEIVFEDVDLGTAFHSTAAGMWRRG